MGKRDMEDKESRSSTVLVPEVNSRANRNCSHTSSKECNVVYERDP